VSTAGSFNLIDAIGQHDAGSSSSDLFPFVGGFFNDASLSTITAAGSNVSVSLANVSITFSSVNTAGTTNVAATSTAQTPPSGFSLAGLTFDITTTATYAPPVTVCFSVPAITDPTVFFNLRILHSENGVLVDRTTTLDFTAKTVCGQVSSFSPFALARPIEPQDTKRTVLGELTELRASGNLIAHDAEKLDEAIKQLTASLDQSLWIDGFRLQAKRGDKDFDEEKQTVNKLRELLQDDNTAVARTTLRQFIERIVGADKVLALTAISDAQATHVDEKQIANAQAEIAEGEADLLTANPNRYESAIDHYGKAWRDAIKLLSRFDEQKQSAKDLRRFTRNVYCFFPSAM
jgi:hypothetical protein